MLAIGQLVHGSDLAVPLWAIAVLTAATAPLAAAFPRHLVRGG